MDKLASEIAEAGAVPEQIVLSSIQTCLEVNDPTDLLNFMIESGRLQRSFLFWEPVVIAADENSRF